MPYKQGWQWNPFNTMMVVAGIINAIVIVLLLSHWLAG